MTGEIGDQSNGQGLGLKDRLTSTLFLGKPNLEIRSDSEYQALLPTLRKVHEKAWVWHGTGRYQYSPPSFDTERDVLQTIIVNDGLTPHFDPLDPVKGEMMSVSTALPPAYAELYAERHFPKGKRLGNYAVQESDGTTQGFLKRLNDARRSGFQWGYYVLGSVIEAGKHLDEASIAMRFMRENKRNKRADSSYVSKYDYYHQKYSKGKVRKLDMVRGGGSDIEGNYPILIGVMHGSFEPADITSLIRRHEVRSQSQIRMRDFTHIEVPKIFVGEVQEVLQRNQDILESNGVNDLSVVPMEWGEEYRKTLPPSYVLDGKALSA